MPTKRDEESITPIEIRLFDPTQHTRVGFDCGVKRLNNFLLRSAKKQQKSDLIRVYVALHPGSTQILGYHAINAFSLCADDLGPLKPKATPPHNTLPAIYLSMIAVDQASQGDGIGGMLLMHAEQKALNIADQIGAYAMILDVIDDDGKAAERQAWYSQFGFQSFPSMPLKMFLPIDTIRKTFALT